MTTRNLIGSSQNDIINSLTNSTDSANQISISILGNTTINGYDDTIETLEQRLTNIENFQTSYEQGLIINDINGDLIDDTKCTGDFLVQNDAYIKGNNLNDYSNLQSTVYDNQIVYNVLDNILNNKNDITTNSNLITQNISNISTNSSNITTNTNNILTKQDTLNSSSIIDISQATMNNLIIDTLQAKTGNDIEIITNDNLKISGANSDGYMLINENHPYNHEFIFNSSNSGAEIKFTTNSYTHYFEFWNDDYKLIDMRRINNEFNCYLDMDLNDNEINNVDKINFTPTNDFKLVFPDDDKTVSIYRGTSYLNILGDNGATDYIMQFPENTNSNIISRIEHNFTVGLKTNNISSLNTGSVDFNNADLTGINNITFNNFTLNNDLDLNENGIINVNSITGRNALADIIIYNHLDLQNKNIDAVNSIYVNEIYKYSNAETIDFNNSINLTGQSIKNVSTIYTSYISNPITTGGVVLIADSCSLSIEGDSDLYDFNIDTKADYIELKSTAGTTNAYYTLYHSPSHFTHFYRWLIFEKDIMDLTYEGLDLKNNNIEGVNRLTTDEIVSNNNTLDINNNTSINGDLDCKNLTISNTAGTNKLVIESSTNRYVQLKDIEDNRFTNFGFYTPNNNTTQFYFDVNGEINFRIHAEEQEFLFNNGDLNLQNNNIKNVNTMNDTFFINEVQEINITAGSSLTMLITFENNFSDISNYTWIEIDGSFNIANVGDLERSNWRNTFITPNNGFMLQDGSPQSMAGFGNWSISSQNGNQFKFTTDRTTFNTGSAELFISQQIKYSPNNPISNVSITYT